MRYIGIKGHKGSGKKSIAWLLGNTMNLIMKGHHVSDNDSFFDIYYDHWCQQIISNEDIIYDEFDSYNISFESFSDSIKIMVRLLTGCPDEYLYDDSYKDNMVINLKDFSYNHKDLLSNITLVTAEEMYNSIDKEGEPKVITKNIWMTFREFIMYFGFDVMQRYFGKNVWVKTLNNESICDDLYGDEYYKIFIDVKTPAEATYIKDKEGILINVINKTRKKTSKAQDRLGKENDEDYYIEVNGDLRSTKDDIIKIAFNILKSNKNE